ncbi:Histone chaperone asf1, partial [Coemansia guatemalensis]
VPVLEKVDRNILASKPRVTRFPIGWGDEPAEPLQQAGGNAAAPVDYMAGSDMMEADEQIAESSEEDESESDEEESDNDGSVVDLDAMEERDEAGFQSDGDAISVDDETGVFGHADKPDEKIGVDMAKGSLSHPSSVGVDSMDVED